ncbi:Transcription factor bHLH110 [Linum perenne]
MIRRSDNSTSGYDHDNYHPHPHPHQLIDHQSSKDDYSWRPQPQPPPPPPHLRSLMNCINIESFEANDLLLSKIKEEMPDAFPKLRDMNIYGSNSPPSREANHSNLQFINNNNNYFLNSGFSDPHHHLYDHHHGHNDTSNKGTSTWDQDSSCSNRSSYVMPSINVLTSNLCSSLVSSSLDLNLRAMDHHHLRHGAPASGSSSHSTSSRNSMQMISHHFMGDSPSHSSNNKTDTASVLTEAIGYIQFLHDQVQSSRDHHDNHHHQHHHDDDHDDHDHHYHHHHHEQQKEDLKSRGLCLVPQSFASYLNTYNLG